MKAAGFDAAWNVITNPSTDNVTDQVAQTAMGLFDDAYTTMLDMLSSFYAYYVPEEPDKAGNLVPGSGPNGKISAALQDCAFAPLMTMVLRPLAEIITRLPAGDGVHTAGPAWAMPDDDRTLTPTTDPWFYLNRFTTMIETIGRLPPSRRMRSDPASTTSGRVSRGCKPTSGGRLASRGIVKSCGSGHDQAAV